MRGRPLFVETPIPFSIFLIFIFIAFSAIGVVSLKLIKSL